VLAAALLAPAQPVQAQRGASAAPSRGAGWLPRLSYFDAAYFSAPHTAAEQSAMLARLLEIERIVLQVAELARPEGFEIEPILYPGGLVGTWKESVFGYRYSLMMYNPTKAIAGEGCGCIEVRVNSDLGGLKSPYGDERGEIYFEEEPGEPVPGATHVWSRLSPTDPSFVTVMFTKDGGSPWKSVTREHFLEAVIEQAEGRNGEKLGEARQYYARTRYEEWLAEAPTRKKQREGTLAAVDPTQRDELRKVLEAAERETGEEMQKADASDRSENARQLAALTEYGDRFRARLAAMSPTERLKPAWLDRMDSSGEFRFVEPGSPRSIRVLQLDPGFYRARRSRTEVWTISVQIKARGTGATPEVQPALYAAFRKLDWAALARLLEPAR
jgi:hypothetical protein